MPLFTIDMVDAATLLRPEHLWKIMPMKWKGFRAAKQGTSWTARSRSADFTPKERLHPINKPETFVIE
ncbi:MAG: hypothetical protein WCH43_08125 [Verrucomicrobiota bacterium]